MRAGVAPGGCALYALACNSLRIPCSPLSPMTWLGACQTTSPPRCRREHLIAVIEALLVLGLPCAMQPLDPRGAAGAVADG